VYCGIGEEVPGVYVVLPRAYCTIVCPQRRS
jgi:hypothetical protein